MVPRTLPTAATFLASILCEPLLLTVASRQDRLKGLRQRIGELVREQHQLRVRQKKLRADHKQLSRSKVEAEGALAELSARATGEATWRAGRPRGGTAGATCDPAPGVSNLDALQSTHSQRHACVPIEHCPVA